MPLISPSALSRRQFLQAGIALAFAAPSRLVFADERPAAPHEQTAELRVGKAQTRMVGNDYPGTEVWAYNGVEPGPVLRLRQGTPFRAIVANGLMETTTVHWHGIRLPNSMDGVPGLTQKPIKPGERFDYAFTPPDAGTFWYHSHDNGLVQMGRGLAGALIVEEANPPAVDRELLWTIQDWRLTGDAQIAPGFNNRMEAAMDGRVGNTVTINGRVPDTVRVRAGERIRLRLLNAAIARSRTSLWMAASCSARQCAPTWSSTCRVTPDSHIAWSTISMTGTPIRSSASSTIRLHRFARIPPMRRCGCQPTPCHIQI